MVESIQNGKSLKQALCEQLDKANEDERVVMKKTLDELNIDYSTDKKNEMDSKSDMTANDDGVIMVKELQDSLLVQRKLESQITSLQEKLSVCYAKEAKYQEDISKYKDAIRNLSESVSNVKALQNKVSNLTEQLDEKNLIIEQEQAKYKKMMRNHQTELRYQSNLNESISAQKNKLKEKELIIKNLNENFKSLQQESQDRENSLQENLAEIKKNLTIKTNEYNMKLTKANELIEQYRKTAKTAVNKYIELQALRLGINSNEIKNKLHENYSFNDIDEICESLSNFNLTVSNLPLNIKQGTIKIKESTEPLLKSNTNDYVDDSLLRLANLT